MFKTTMLFYVVLVLASFSGFYAMVERSLEASAIKVQPDSMFLTVLETKYVPESRYVVDSLTSDVEIRLTKDSSFTQEDFFGAFAHAGYKTEMDSKSYVAYAQGSRQHLKRSVLRYPFHIDLINGFSLNVSFSRDSSLNVSLDPSAEAMSIAQLEPEVIDMPYSEFVYVYQQEQNVAIYTLPHHIYVPTLSLDLNDRHSLFSQYSVPLLRPYDTEYPAVGQLYSFIVGSKFQMLVKIESEDAAKILLISLNHGQEALPQEQSEVHVEESHIIEAAVPPKVEPVVEAEEDQPEIVAEPEAVQPEIAAPVPDIVEAEKEAIEVEPEGLPLSESSAEALKAPPEIVSDVASTSLDQVVFEEIFFSEEEGHGPAALRRDD